MDFLRIEAEKFDIKLNQSQLEKFKIYMNFLIEYNSHTNLTSITLPEDIMIKHFLDSIVINRYIKESQSVIDVGTGAGFPGIPLKICNETINLSLVDSLNKRIKFLNDLIIKLDLEIQTFHARAEELSLNSGFREKFDIALSRAVAPLNILLEYCLPYVKKGGCFIALKGPDIDEEIKTASKAVKILGGKIEEKISFDLPLNKGKRTILIIRKQTQTPKGYPRKNSKISSLPL